MQCTHGTVASSESHLRLALEAPFNQYVPAVYGSEFKAWPFVRLGEVLVVFGDREPRLALRFTRASRALAPHAVKQ
jgi:hypothetical protein